MRNRHCTKRGWVFRGDGSSIAPPHGMPAGKRRRPEKSSVALFLILGFAQPAFRLRREFRPAARSLGVTFDSFA